MKSQFSFIYAAVTRLLSVCIIGETPDGGGGGTPLWNRRGCSSEILNLTPE